MFIFFEIAKIWGAGSGCRRENLIVLPLLLPLKIYIFVLAFYLVYCVLYCEFGETNLQVYRLQFPGNIPKQCLYIVLSDSVEGMGVTIFILNPERQYSFGFTVNTYLHLYKVKNMTIFQNIHFNLYHPQFPHHSAFLENKSGSTPSQRSKSYYYIKYIISLVFSFQVSTCSAAYM